MEVAAKEDALPIHILEVMGSAIVGGVEQYIVNLARSFPALGFKVSCIAPFESPVTEKLRELGCEVYVAQMEDNPPWRSIQFITDLVRLQRVDLLHAHMHRAQSLAGLVGSLAHIPTVMTVHGMDIPSWELGIQRTTGAFLTVVCQAAYTQALALGIPPEKVALVPNGVDLHAFRPQRSGARFRRTLQIPEAAFLVGFVGRFSFEKGPDMFVQMAQHIHRQRPDVHFVMVGDGPLRQELASQVQTAGLEDHLHLAGEWDHMPEVYPALNVLAQTSRVEGMPLTLLEAMASGVPVAAMSAGGVAEVVQVGGSGMLAAVGDWAGLGQAVLKLVQDPGLQMQMGRAGRRRVERRFDLAASHGRLAHIFRDLLGQPQPQAERVPTGRNIFSNGSRRH